MICSRCLTDSYERRKLTCVLQHKSVTAQRRIAAESQKQGVGAALDVIWNICAVETAQQRAEGVGPVVDVQEVVTGLQTEPGNNSGDVLIGSLE